jgi:host factor-I protein
MMAKSVLNIQDSFLNQARRERISLTVRLTDGTCLEGRITAFDNFTMILFNEESEEQYLIYKHSMACLAPAAKTIVRWNNIARGPTREGDRDLRSDRPSGGFRDSMRDSDYARDDRG